MSSKRKISLDNLEGLDITNKSDCDCGCKKCKTENKILREKLIQLYEKLGRKVTRQSLNGSTIEIPKNNREVSTKGCSCKKSCSSRCGCYKKDFACGDRCKCDKSICGNQHKESGEKSDDDNTHVQDEVSNITERKIKTAISKENSDDKENINQNESFDPMKPRYQIPRSPVTVKNNLSMRNDFDSSNPESHLTPLLRVSNVDVSLANASIKSMASDLPEELQQPIVDWEKHKAELQKCPKCKRTFIPVRLQKHEQICKGL